MNHEIVASLLALPPKISIPNARVCLPKLDSEYSVKMDQIVVPALEFYLAVFVNGPNDVRVAYQSQGGVAWYNPYWQPGIEYTCDFLWLAERIDSDELLCSRLFECLAWLMENKLLPTIETW